MSVDPLEDYAERDPYADDTSEDLADDGTELVYASVDLFVAHLIAPTWCRPVDGRHLTWCPSWWKHPEAIMRLEALWRSWEHLRMDPATGLSVWMLDHADRHMRVLMDPDLGPFKGCHPERGHGDRLRSLPLVQPPEGLFTHP